MGTKPKTVTAEEAVAFLQQTIDRVMVGIPHGSPAHIHADDLPKLYKLRELAQQGAFGDGVSDPH